MFKELTDKEAREILTEDGWNKEEVEEIMNPSIIKGTSEVTLPDHPLPKKVTVEVIRLYSAAELTVHYKKSDAVRLAKENKIKGYSKYKEEELWQFLKDNL